jgi:hypothetical protein
MEEKEMKEFTLPALLLVTGVSFLLFDVFLRISYGAGNKFFLCAGMMILSSGIFAAASILITYAGKVKKE